MKSIFTILITLLLPTIGYSQTNYVNGAIITHQKDTLKGLINDQEWMKSPSSVQFKPIFSNQEKTYKSSEIDGFFIENGDKYVSKSFSYEHLPRNITKSIFPFREKYTYRPKNIRQTESFVRLLSKGKINLYQYNDSEEEVHFLIEQTQKLTVLVYHRILLNNDAYDIKEYQMQVQSACLQCQKLGIEDFLKLEYKPLSLTKIIEKYNECMDTNFKSKSIVSKNKSQ